MQGETTASCCGSSGCCGSTTESWDPITSNLYDEGQTAGVPAEALLASLGCGNPTALTALHEGETVLDLGSGGGIDVLLSAKRVRVAGSPFRMWWFVARHRMKSNATWSADLIVGTEARI